MGGYKLWYGGLLPANTWNKKKIIKSQTFTKIPTLLTARKSKNVFFYVF